jgi:hypothetical protein
MNKDPKALEEQAFSLLSQGKFEEAYKAYSEAATSYRAEKNHTQAALCFASAASCWSIKSGEKTFFKAARAYESAATQAQASGDLEYASLLYKYAAINHERDREMLDFSECLYRSRECHRKFLTYRLFTPNKIHPIAKWEEEKGFFGFIKRIISWVAINLSYLAWGHGERPLRAFSFGVSVVTISAFLYMHGTLLNGSGDLFRPRFLDALYFSIVTFSTVGYGDIVPVGVSRLLGAAEALSGIFIMPLFIISLTRRYLRI